MTGPHFVLDFCRGNMPGKQKECEKCGRKMRSDNLKKHAKICKIREIMRYHTRQDQNISQGHGDIVGDIVPYTLTKKPVVKINKTRENDKKMGGVLPNLVRQKPESANVTLPSIGRGLYGKRDEIQHCMSEEQKRVIGHIMNKVDQKVDMHVKPMMRKSVVTPIKTVNAVKPKPLTKFDSEGSVESSESDEGENMEIDDYLTKLHKRFKNLNVRLNDEIIDLHLIISELERAGDLSKEDCKAICEHFKKKIDDL